MILLRDIPRDIWTGYMDGREHVQQGVERDPQQAERVHQVGL